MSNKIIAGSRALSDAEWYEFAFAYFASFFGDEAATRLLAAMPGAPPRQSPEGES